MLADVKPGQPAYDDELFGPVASVIKAKDDEDAMRIANDSRYGLGGGIFSKDEATARELASKHFDTGMVCINGFNVGDPEHALRRRQGFRLRPRAWRLRHEGVRQHQVGLHPPELIVGITHG